MNVSGERSKRKEFAKQVGFFEAEVVAFNPDREGFEALGFELRDDKDPEYIGEKEGDTTFRLSIWLREVKSKQLFNLNLYLADKEVTSKDGNKKQYVNDIGRNTWVDDVDNLNEKFTAYDYHVARVGEVDVIEFLMSWLQVDWTKPYTIGFDWKKVMNGSVKEFNDLLKSQYSKFLNEKTGLEEPATVVLMAEIKTIKKDGEDDREVQSVYNRAFLPGYTMKTFRTKKFTPEVLKALRDRDKKARDTKDWKKYGLKNWEKFVVDITDEEYGSKNFFVLEPLRDYNPEENLVSSDKVIDQDDSSY